jgi:hypothetical protein
MVYEVIDDFMVFFKRHYVKLKYNKSINKLLVILLMVLPSVDNI